jgi:hypothetical protein
MNSAMSVRVSRIKKHFLLAVLVRSEGAPSRLGVSSTESSVCYLPSAYGRHIDTYWVSGANNLVNYGRWAFAEFCEVYQIESDFETRVEAEFQRMLAAHLPGARS